MERKQKTLATRKRTKKRRYNDVDHEIAERFHQPPSLRQPRFKSNCHGTATTNSFYWQTDEAAAQEDQSQMDDILSADKTAKMTNSDEENSTVTKNTAEKSKMEMQLVLKCPYIKKKEKNPLNKSKKTITTKLVAKTTETATATKVLPVMNLKTLKMSTFTSIVFPTSSCLKTSMDYAAWYYTAIRKKDTGRQKARVLFLTDSENILTALPKRLGMSELKCKSSSRCGIGSNKASTYAYKGYGTVSSGSASKTQVLDEVLSQVTKGQVWTVGSTITDLGYWKEVLGKNEMGYVITVQGVPGMQLN